MESEAFVANEYIGACYYLSCTDCGATDYSKNQFSMNGIENMGNSGVYMYKDEISGKVPCFTENFEGKPAWIEGISERPGKGIFAFLFWVSWPTVEELVYAWYKYRGGQDDITIETYHPAITGQTDAYTYPAHPNHS